MIRALLGRFTLLLAFIMALLSAVVPFAGLAAAVLIAVGIFTCAHSQRHVWHDGWHAAHEHHKIRDGHRHLSEYTNFIARQPN